MTKECKDNSSSENLEEKEELKSYRIGHTHLSPPNLKAWTVAKGFPRKGNREERFDYAMLLTPKEFFELWKI